MFNDDHFFVFHIDSDSCPNLLCGNLNEDCSRFELMAELKREYYRGLRKIEDNRSDFRLFLLFCRLELLFSDILSESRVSLKPGLGDVREVIRIFNDCEVLIENSVTRVTVRLHE